MSFPYLVYPYKDFHNFLSNVLLSETMCRFHDSVCWLKVKVTIEGHEFEPLILCHSHISFTPIRIFIIFLSNVLLSETMCRFHDSVCWLKVKVTIEGHEFEPLILCRSHISFTPKRIFIKNFLSNVLPVRRCADSMTQYAGSKSRSQLKVTSLNL